MMLIQATFVSFHSLGCYNFIFQTQGCFWEKSFYDHRNNKVMYNSRLKNIVLYSSFYTIHQT